MKKAAAWVALALVALIVIGAAHGSASHSKATTVASDASVPPVSIPATPAPTTDPSTTSTPTPVSTPAPAPAPKPKAKPKPKPAPPAAPQPTAGQANALQSAQGYLSDGQGFSREGLIQQLSSSAGEGFGMADSTWAVDHANADWNQQAVESAQGYMSDGQGFSRSGLMDQLTSSYGEGFTEAQAAYAVDKVYH